MSKADNWTWYKRNPREFLRDVQGLGPELIGAYDVTTELIMAEGASIPNDARWLGGILGCSSRKAASLVMNLLSLGKLVLDSEGRLMNEKAVSELENRADLHRKARESGAKGGRAYAENVSASRNNNDLGRATVEHIEQTILEKKDSPSKPVSQPPPLAIASETRPHKSIQKEFEQFYQAFPRHVGRGDAERAYWRSRKLASADQILDGARRYANARRGEDQKFTKHPATWLNGKGWLDEIGGSPPQPQADLQTWIRRLELFHHGDDELALSAGYWGSLWGPPPARPGCLVPAEASRLFAAKHPAPTPRNGARV